MDNFQKMYLPQIAYYFILLLQDSDGELAPKGDEESNQYQFNVATTNTAQGFNF